MASKQDKSHHIKPAQSFLEKKEDYYRSNIQVKKKKKKEKGRYR